MTTNIKKPFVPISEIEQSSFCRSKDQLLTAPLGDELKINVGWQKIPSDYLVLDSEELDRRIHLSRELLGKRVVILGHHYQREEVIKHTDVQGDSFKLSQYAASISDAEHVIFCGVHFMAETASILCGENQKVILPNMAAGCSMAEMAPTDDVVDAWNDLQDVLGNNGGIVPITYMNSTAAIKALCGRNGGIVCTSSNASEVFDWAFKRGERIFFIPDQHLGRNTGLKKGISLDEMIVWNPFKPLGGHSRERLISSRVILWQGHCSVHTRFTAKQIDFARVRYPDVRVIVHPECVVGAVEAADMSGSTEEIRRVVNGSPPGSKWGIGTEINLVNRLAINNPDKTIFCLDPVVCPCSTMYRIHPAYLCWVLEGLLEGHVVNQVKVDDDTKEMAFIALDRMLQVGG